MRRRAAIGDRVDRRLLSKRGRRLVPVAVIGVLALVASVTLAATVSARVTHSVRLSSVRLPTSFVAQGVVAAAGEIWVLGSTGENPATGCTLDEVTPATMTSTLLPLPACASYITEGGGRIFLVVTQGISADNVRAYHVEVFDPATHVAHVLSPIVLNNVGSAIAHMGFVYGDGALWLYGYQYPAAAPTVVRISPTSGAVESTIGAVPAIGGIFPAVAANEAGTWLGGGPGGPPAVEWVRPGATAGTTAYAAPATQNSSVMWLSSVGDRVWAGIAVYGHGTGPSRTSVTTRLVALRPDGTVALTSPAEATSDIPLVATAGGTRLWDLTSGTTCERPMQLVQVDPSSGREHDATTLAALNACDGIGSAELAAVGDDVFALAPGDAPGTSILYRAAT